MIFDASSDIQPKTNNRKLENWRLKAEYSKSQMQKRKLSKCS